MRFASATSSATLLTGCEGCTTIATGASATRAIGVKSRSASYGNFLYRAGLMACVPTVAMSSVRPSGAALATASAPNEPPAPPRLSITIIDLSASPNICAKGRATISVGPPAGNGTIRRICLPANDCAAAFSCDATELTATAHTARKATRRNEVPSECRPNSGKSWKFTTSVSRASYGLQQLGWTIGRNIRIDYRWGDGKPDTMRKYAAELVALDALGSEQGLQLRGICALVANIPAMGVTGADRDNAHRRRISHHGSVHKRREG